MQSLNYLPKKHVNRDSHIASSHISQSFFLCGSIVLDFAFSLRKLYLREKEKIRDTQSTQNSLKRRET